MVLDKPRTSQYKRKTKKVKAAYNPKPFQKLSNTLVFPIFIQLKNANQEVYIHAYFNKSQNPARERIILMVVVITRFLDLA
jgi:uncharacterized membrane protein